MKRWLDRYWIPGMLAAGGVCASLILLWITGNGLGVSPDSVVYIEAARNVLAGGGLTASGQPMTHYPPLYPLLLALGGFIWPDFMQAARMLQVALFGVNAILVGAIVSKGTGNSMFAVGLALAGAIVSAPVLLVHAMSWSEPLFLTCLLTAFLLLLRQLDHPGRAALLGGALAAGLAVATRYVGVALLPPLAAGLLLFGAGPAGRRLKEAGLFLATALVPAGLWLIRNLLVASSAVDRQFVAHPIGWDGIQSLIVTLADFLLPFEIPFWVEALALGTVVVLAAAWSIFRYARSRREARAAAFPEVMVMWIGLVILSYLAGLLASISFIDAQTPLDARILLPVFILTHVAVLIWIWSLTWRAGRKAIGLAVVLGLMAVLVLDGRRAVAFAKEFHRDGKGYTDALWRASETISFVQTIPDETTIYTNGPDAMLFLIGRPARDLPQTADQFTLAANPEYANQLSRVCREVGEGGAVLVYFDRIGWRWYLPNRQQLNAACNLPVLRELGDGAVYGR